MAKNLPFSCKELLGAYINSSISLKTAQYLSSDSNFSSYHYYISDFLAHLSA